MPNKLTLMYLVYNSNWPLIGEREIYLFFSNMLWILIITASSYDTWFADVITVKVTILWEHLFLQRARFFEKSPNEFVNNFFNGVTIKCSQVKNKRSKNVKNLLAKIQMPIFYCKIIYNHSISRACSLAASLHHVIFSDSSLLKCLKIITMSKSS